MKLSKSHTIDPMTGLPNFISFFNDNFKEVYGNKGTLLMFKPKSVSQINRKHGRGIGDDLFKAIGSYIHENVEEKCYRHDTGGFLIVYKEQDALRTNKHILGLNETIRSFAYRNNVDELSLSHVTLSYDQPLKSIADYYQLFFETYNNENTQLEAKEMFYQVLEDISYRIKDIIGSYESARDYAFYDEISGLSNSKSANVYLEDLKECKQDYAILFIDGDSLKRFNNVSYELGNNAIKEIAGSIMKSIRSTDKVFRWLSGDEFIVVAIDITNEDTVILAERIRHNVEKHFANQDIPATVSIGISIYPRDGEDVSEILINAERANKFAKTNGKNRFEFFSEECV